MKQQTLTRILPVLAGMLLLPGSIVPAGAMSGDDTTGCPEGYDYPELQSGTARIEVVFTLDTTGSMSGLIDGAKRKIWWIANGISRSRPAPDIRMGLVGYRDRGDAYVTKNTPLTADIDFLSAGHGGRGQPGERESGPS
jgi:hypothetical protein